MSLVLTLMQPLRAKYNGTLDKNESRPSRYGAWDLFNNQSKDPTGIFTSDIRSKIKASFGNSVQVPVINYNGGITIGDVRSCTVADAENTSALVTLTLVSYVFGFTMYPAMYENNDIKRQEDFTRKMNDRLIALAATLDTACVSHLETNKNQFWTGISGVPYTITSNSMQVPLASKNDFYNQAQSILQRMDFYGQPNILTSPHGGPLVRRNLAQGQGNDINQNFQFDPYEFWWTNRITPESGFESKGYIVQDGSLAIETRVDHDARMGSRIGDETIWETVNVPLPGTPNGIELASYYHKECADGSSVQSSGTSGNTRTMRESFEFSVDVCFSSAYNSSPSTRFSPIAKFEISNS